MLLLSVTFNGVSLPEVFGSALTQLMPPPLFDTLHQLIGGDAKHYLFYGIFVGQCLVFALSGGLCALWTPALLDRLPARARTVPAQRDERENNVPSPIRTIEVREQLSWRTGLVLAFLLWLLVGFVFLPLTGVGIFGSHLTIGPLNTLVSLAVDGLAFGVMFVLIQNWLVLRRLHMMVSRNGDVEAASQTLREANTSRRILLRRGFELLGLGVIGVAGWKFITSAGSLGSMVASTGSVPVSKLLQNFIPKISPPPQPNYGAIQQVPLLSPEVTSNEQYYVVSKNLFSDPSVNAANWNLSVGGLVSSPYTLSYQELSALPRKQQYESMMCISNEVGGSYMSNALWEGVPLADLLARAGAIRPGATKVVLYAADDYSDSIHLSKALEPTTLVALRMNGQTLPQGHGFPARLLVPGIYGMKHVKWITKIEVVNTDFQGYWQQRGWSDAAPIRLTSRIDTPLTGKTLPANKLTYVAGVAFSGNKGISAVDVSFDMGNTWTRATLKKPLSALTWVLWELPWQPKAGNYTIAARAIDLQGNVQDPHENPPLPDGSSGYDSITVTVG
jgi:DMSO/TMAO reductase YedYZ molybdopterin-dependent catalytic subunit